MRSRTPAWRGLAPCDQLRPVCSCLSGDATHRAEQGERKDGGEDLPLHLYLTNAEVQLSDALTDR